MEIVDLKYLAACADTGRFALAAKTLGVDTSTVSRRIGNLEDELGLSLFDREHSGIRPTPGGRAAIRCARQVLSDLESMARTGRQYATGHVGEIRLGIRTPPVGGIARDLLTAWRSAYGNVAITVMELNERELALGLTERRLDAALVPGHTTWPNVTAFAMYRERIVAAVPASHSLAVNETVSWSALSPETILVQGWEDNQAQREYYATLLGSGCRFQVHAASKQTILALVGTGIGVTLALESQAEATFPGVVFRSIAEENAWIEIDLVWIPQSEDPIVGRFVAFMRDESRVRGFV